MPILIVVRFTLSYGDEFITEVCNRHDFELTCLTNELRNAVETYNEMIELVILMRFRCGNVAWRLYH